MFEKSVRGQTLVVMVMLLFGLTSSAFGQELKRNQHALLVGCTVYPNLAKNYHLVGPANDVFLAKNLLIERFKFPEDNVTILADNAGGADKMPTRANIERQWRRLADVAQKGDQILVLMAGHGTQAPQLIMDDNPETDGLDEVFLPRDVGSWNDQVGTVENAIKDDDIRQWISGITDKGASLWIIIDACHSGTMTRDAGDEVKREVAPETLGVPEAALQKAYALAAKRGTAHDAEESQLLDSPEKTRGVPGSAASADPNAPVVVALYASQSIEPTVEKKLPIGAVNRQYYGLLTYTLSEILSQAESNMTYRELAAQIHRQYVKMGRVSPTPVLEGTAIDREVLGLEAFPQRSRIVVSKDGVSGGWKINAGALSGMTKGSILALYPPAGEANADKVVGHVRIPDDGVRALEAQVAPCAYNNLPPPAELAAGMRGETVFVDFGDQRLKIGVDRATDQGDPISTDEWRDLALPLSQFAKDNAHLVQMVMSSEADWLLRYDNTKSKKLFLVPAAGRPGQKEGTQLPPLFGPAPTVDALDSWLNDSLTRIARVQTLLRFSAQGIEDAENLDIQILRYQDATDKAGQPVEYGRGEVKLHDGDAIGFQVENKGREPLDATILLIDSGYGIHPLFPSAGETNRLFPGNKVVKRGAIDATTTGQEHLVVIAVKGKPVDQPVNFAFLAQPTLERTRSAAGEKNPISELLIGAMFGGQTERTRGFAAATVDDYHLSTRAWKTMPTKRPK